MLATARYPQSKPVAQKEDQNDGRSCTLVQTEYALLNAFWHWHSCSVVLSRVLW